MLYSKSFCWRFILLLGLLLFGAKAWSLSFEILVPNHSIYIGQSFELRFQLSGQQRDVITELRLPNFRDIEIVAGPMTSSQSTYVNGQSSFSYSYVYQAVAKRAGKIEIEGLEAVLGSGKTIRARSIELEILQNRENQDVAIPRSSLGDQAFLLLELSNKNPVVGEQVFLDLRLYWQIPIEYYKILRDPVFQDMYSKALDHFEDISQQVRVKGKPYYTQVLRRIALFPSKAGTIRIDPASLYLGVSSGSRGFGGNYRVDPHTISSSPITMQVSTLDASPPGFRGTVGDYTCRLSAAESISSDEVLKLKIVVEGSGDIRQISKPRLLVDEEAWDVFPPEIEDYIQERPSSLAGRRVFEYSLSPKKTGMLEIEPEFRFFNSKTRRFEGLDTTLRIQVYKGKRPLASSSVEEQAALLEQELEEPLVDYHPAQEFAGFRKKETLLLFYAPSFYLFLLLGPFALGLLWFWSRYKASKAEEWAAVAEESKRSAWIEKQLARAQEARKAGDAKAFYEALGFALQEYLGHKLQLPPAAWSRMAWQERLLQSKCPETLCLAWDAFLRKCQYALFSGTTGAEDMKQAYQEASDLLQACRQFFEQKQAS